MKTYFPPFFILLIVILLHADATSQETYQRAKINLKDKNPFILIRAGISIDHGKMALGRYFESDFSETEIRKIKQLGFDVEIRIKDVEEYYSRQDRPSEIYRADVGDRFVSCSPPISTIKTPASYFDGSMGGYLTYNEMLIALEFMQSTYPFMITKLDTIKGSKTTDGNYILSLKVSDNPNVDENEPEVLYTALHHAREPNSMSQMIFYLWYLCENYTTNPEVKYLVDNTEMYFIPCVNPDGYKLNEKNKPTGGGLWRKNTKKSGNTVVGVDLNRNYGFNWGFDNVGSSNNPNSDTYRGDKAFSEKETSSIREFLAGRKIMMSMNYHSFGNLLIHPWGYSDSPTAEDKLFKGFAKQMTKENNFFTGTGSQTVGYTVNGDADDYMYGETLEKAKIFSMTPEVGPSFWPKKTDIDYLNKSCLHMNLSLPRLVNGYLYSSLDNRSKIYKNVDTIAIKVTKPSFKLEDVGVRIYTNAALNAKESTYQINLKQGQDTLLNFAYDLHSPALSVGRNEVVFYIEKNHGGYKHLDSLTIDIFKGDRIAIFRDRAANFVNFSNEWGISSLSGTYVSEPASFTDSPGSLYGLNTKNKMQLKNPIDLSNAKSPYLTFNASWNIEANYDYARAYAYVPGGNVVTLCGNFTKPGSLDQLSGQPVFDGDQSDFVQEVMSLEEFQGQKEVYIGFEMVSDAGLNLDGIYIDDIEIVTFKQGVPTKDQVLISPHIVPNPSNGIFTIKNLSGAAKVTIYDLTGKKVVYTEANQADQIDLSFLKSGTYIAKIFSNDKVFNEKIIIAN